MMPTAEGGGRRVLVTGGAQGIGRAITQFLMDRGHHVAVLDRTDVQEPGLIVVRADLSDSTEVARAVDGAVDALGGLDVLVNNAGVGAAGGVEDNDDDEWQSVLDINVVGTARVTRAALPALRRSPYPAIVNVCSVASVVGLPSRVLYSASKGAILAMTTAMAVDFLAEGIRVNAVNPGTTDTPWVQRLLESSTIQSANARPLSSASRTAGWSPPRRSPPQSTISLRRQQGRRPARRSRSMVV